MKKPSIQRIILRTLSNKRTVPIDFIRKNVQNFINSRKNNQNLEDNKEKTNYAITRSIRNLINDGLVESFSSERNQYFRLTNEGKQKLNDLILKNKSSLVSIKWDGFWRIIILDLPEERKNEREALRYLLKKAGFICLKNSVWISMYPFEHLFTNIKKDLNLSSEMIIIATNKIDKETEKEFFSLFKNKE